MPTPAPVPSPAPAPTPPAPPAPAPAKDSLAKPSPDSSAAAGTPAASPFAKLDSLKTLQNQEKAKQQELEKQATEAKQDSLAIKGKIETLKSAKMKELDSLRQALNNRFKYLKDSLAVEKEKFLKFQNSAETLDKLKKQKEVLPGEITKLHGQAKDIRERAQNLKELAKFEFDIDTSARARDSLLKTSRALDSAAGAKETLLKGVDAEMASLSSMKPEDAARETARIDSVEKALPAVQKTEFTALLQKQAALDQMLAAARTQMVADAKERLKKLSVDLKAAAALIKKIDVEMAGLEREMRKKR
jgi:Txe/YoeB family toxin of Txe-Axe toxin-antitoxin module